MVPTGPVELDRKNPLSDALVGYYIPGVTRRDFSDFSADLTVSSGITAVSPTSYGPGLYFDGSASYVAAQKNVYPYTSTHNLNTLTLSALLYLPTTPTILSQFLTLGYPQDGNHPTGLMYYGGSDLNYGGNNWQVDSGTPPPIGSVFLFTAVTDYSAGTLTMYVNDKAVYGPTVVTPTASLNGPATLNLSYWGKYSKVSYVAASVWKRALSPDQVVEFAGNPFSLLRPRTVRRYYAASTSTINNLQITAIFGALRAAAAAQQTQSISQASSFSAASPDITLQQRNSAAIATAFSAAASAFAFNQSNPSSLDPRTGDAAAVLDLVQRNPASLDPRTGDAAAHILLQQGNKVSAQLNLVFPVFTSSFAFVQRNKATLASRTGDATSSIRLAQSNTASADPRFTSFSTVIHLSQNNQSTAQLNLKFSPLKAAIQAAQFNRASLGPSFAAPRTHIVIAQANSILAQFNLKFPKFSSASVLQQSQTASTAIQFADPRNTVDLSQNILASVASRFAPLAVAASAFNQNAVRVRPRLSALQSGISALQSQDISVQPDFTQFVARIVINPTKTWVFTTNRIARIVADNRTAPLTAGNRRVRV